MSEAVIRQKIVDIFNEVPEIGRVYDFPLTFTTWDDFVAHWKDSTGKILGFEISRASAKDTYDDPDESTWTHQFLVKGYMGVNNAGASDNVFQALLDAVCGRFRFDHYLSGCAGQITFVTPMQIIRSEERIFGSVLCHYAELTISVSELIVQ
jgi:hypothetical protein